MKNVSLWADLDGDNGATYFRCGDCGAELSQVLDEPRARADAEVYLIVDYGSVWSAGSVRFCPWCGHEVE